MKKTIIAAALLLGTCLTPIVGTVFAAPSTDTPTTEITAANENDSAEPYMLTKIQVATRADSEYVYAVAKNTFTLFISTVPVHIYLYSSENATFDINEMTLEAEAYTGDLNVNKEITCKAKHTEQRYWVAHCVYTSDKQTKSASSSPVLYSTDGKVIK